MDKKFFIIDGCLYWIHWEPNGWRIYDNLGTKVENKRLRKQLREMYMAQVQTDSLGHLPTPSIPVCLEVPTRSTDMYQNEMRIQEISSDDKARDHLRERLSDTSSSKNSDLRKKYGLEYDQPKSRKEMAEWLKAGKYSIEGLEKFGDDKLPWYASATEYLRWTNTPEDENGYNEAYKKLEAARMATRDTIIVSSPADGLKAFRDFEATTFS